jgi:hypothetical protein
MGQVVAPTATHPAPSISWGLPTLQVAALAIQIWLRLIHQEGLAEPAAKASCSNYLCHLFSRSSSFETLINM